MKYFQVTDKVRRQGPQLSDGNLDGDDGSSSNLVGYYVANFSLSYVENENN